MFLGLLMAVAGGFLASMTKIESLALIGIGAFTGAIVLGFGFFLPARTRAGTQMLARVLGFREFRALHRRRGRRQPDLRGERSILVREAVPLDLAYPTAMILAAEPTPIPRALLNTRG